MDMPSIQVVVDTRVVVGIIKVEANSAIRWVVDLKVKRKQEHFLIHRSHDNLDRQFDDQNQEALALGHKLADQHPSLLVVLCLYASSIHASPAKKFVMEYNQCFFL